MPLSLPVALLCLLVLYSLPACACWLALRKRRKAAAMVVGLVALAVTGYAALVQWPRSVPDFIFWALVAGLPLIASAAALLAALRLPSPQAKNP